MISNDLLEGVRSLLGKGVKLEVTVSVQVETRPDKLEERILILSPFRGYLINLKTQIRQVNKVESSFSFIEINSLRSESNNSVTIATDSRTYKISNHKNSTNSIDKILSHILLSLKNVYIEYELGHPIKSLEVEPKSRLNHLLDEVENKETRPCGGFSYTYECMCDLYCMEMRAEVQWDIDSIFLLHNSKELGLQDFDHLGARDLIPIVSALEYNTWFTKFNANYYKLTIEITNALLKVLSCNKSLEQLDLRSTTIKFDFLQRLCTSLGTNSASHLTSFDFSENSIEDKGVIQLAALLNKLPKPLVSLQLNNVAMTGKGLSKLMDALCNRDQLTSHLTNLNLSLNVLRSEDVSSITSYLAKQSAITHLDLSGMELPLDMISGAMTRGCCHTLVKLNLSKNPFTLKKTRDVSVPNSWRQMFMAFYCLQSAQFSDCRLPPEAVKQMLLGIGENSHIRDFDLDISSNDLRMPGARIVEASLTAVDNIRSLDISDNGFDADVVSILQSLISNPGVTRVSIGRNFSGLKAKGLTDVLESLVCLLVQQDCNIKYLSVAESKLRGDTALIINALSSNSCIEEIDISGNNMGNFGARMLAKSLQINKCLSAVYADKNNISAKGFEDLAAALEKNFTLKKFPSPVNDLVHSMRLNPTRTQNAFQKIESCLQRNHSPRKFQMDHNFTIQQLLQAAPEHCEIGKLVVSTEGSMKKLSEDERAQDDILEIENILKDAESYYKVLHNVQKISHASKQDGNPINVKLTEFFTHLQPSLHSYMEETAERMMVEAKTRCSTILTKELINEMWETCQRKCEIDASFCADLSNIMNMAVVSKMSEVNSSVACQVSSFMTEQLVADLRKSRHLLSYRQRKTSKVSEAGERSDSVGSLASQIKSMQLSEKSRKQRPFSVCDFEQIHTETVSPPLTHLAKARPRRYKMNESTRPMIKPPDDPLDDVINGDASAAEKVVIKNQKLALKPRSQKLKSQDKNDANKPSKKENNTQSMNPSPTIADDLAASNDTKEEPLPSTRAPAKFNPISKLGFGADIMSQLKAKQSKIFTEGDSVEPVDSGNNKVAPVVPVKPQKKRAEDSKIEITGDEDVGGKRNSKKSFGDKDVTKPADDDASNTKRSSATDDTKQSSATDNTKQSSATDNTKRNSSTDDNKRNSATDNKQRSSADETKESSATDNTKRSSATDDTRRSSANSDIQLVNAAVHETDHVTDDKESKNEHDTSSSASSAVVTEIISEPEISKESIESQDKEDKCPTEDENDDLKKSKQKDESDEKDHDEIIV